ncbi:hypothetical protein FSC37_03240 [Piscinibacter aquaticus]|uniref:SMP-30/Gluconolactonase/LRE-like region domain-containing protein n=1 Tax=Piscinibacter aquaticus TaxID=392597 RepID=A0A5C6U190_9BURK|nr:hypothetical protein FSC37_03240 [Piscinibacter aquaticus]
MRLRQRSRSGSTTRRTRSRRKTARFMLPRRSLTLSAVFGTGWWRYTLAHCNLDSMATVIAGRRNCVSRPPSPIGPGNWSLPMQVISSCVRSTLRPAGEGDCRYARSARLAEPRTEATQTTIEYVSWLGFDASGLLWAAMSSATGLEPPRLYWLEPTSRQWRRFDLPDFVTSGVEISGVWVDVGIGVDLLETGGRFLRLTTYSASSRGMSSRFIGGIYRDEAGRTFLGDHTSILMLAADGSEIGRLPRQFANVTSIKRSPSGGLLVVDSDEGRIFRITTTGDVIWSTGTSPSALGVVVSVAQSGGRLLALDNAKPAIIAVDRDGNSSRIAGNGRLAWADISVDAAQTGFLYPSALAADSRGNIFVAEQHRIMRIDASSRQVSLFCGYETAGNIYDAPCATARFNGIRGLAFDSQDRLYVADTYNNQIKRVSVDGSLVELIAGNGLGRTFAELSPRFDVDARQSPLNRPHAVRVSPAGRILVADSWNNAVYSLDQGMLRPFAGVPGHAPQWNELNAPYQGQGEYAGDGALRRARS